MANYFPLILDTTIPEIKELPLGDNLNMANSDLINVSNVTIVSNLTVGGNIIGNTTGSATFGSVTVTGNIESDLLPSSTEVYNLGSPDQRWNEIYLAGGTINLGNATIEANATSIIFTNPAGGVTEFSGAGGELSTNNLFVSNLILASGNIVTTSGNVSGGNINTAGNVSSGNVNTFYIFTGNIDAGNVNTFNVFAGTVTTADVDTANIVTANLAVATIDSIDGSSSIVVNEDIDVIGDVVAANFSTLGNVSANGIEVTTITATNVIGTLLTNAQPNITSVGTLTSLDVTGNITGGNLSGTNVIGTLLTNAQPNITSVGTLTSLAVTGNVSGGNIATTGIVNAVDVTVSGNVNAQTAVNTNLISGTGVAITSSGDLDLQPSGNINVSGVIITNMGAPALAFDAATKQYVDDAVSAGIHIHSPVDVETPAALPAATYAQGGTVLTVTDTVAGNTVVFSTAANLQVNDQLWFANSFNGVVGNLAYFVVSTPNTSAAVLSTAYSGVPVSNITSGSSLTESVRINSGVGATLTANTNGALVIDGVSVVNGDRVLVYQQAQGFENGVYDVTDAGNVSAPWILTRSTDSDQYVPDTNDGIDQGSYYFVKSGDTGAGESYVMTGPVGPFIIGLANLEFTQFSSSQVYTANTNAGLNLTGTTFSAKVDNNTTAFDLGGNISVKASANLTTPNIGNATGNSLTLNGNGLISVVNVSASANINAIGNISSGNLSTTTITATGNITGDYFIGNGALLSGIDATSIQNGNSNVRVVSNGGNVAVSVAGNANVGLFTGTGLVVTGSIEATNGFIGLDATSIANGSANVRTFLNGNVTVSAAGTANVLVITDTGANVEGTFTATGNITGGNIITAGLASLASITKTGSNGVGNIGQVDNSFNTVFARATSALYADLAEMYTADAEYTPGTVLVFGGPAEVTASTNSHSARIAGVVSTEPAHIMNSGLTADHTVAVALMGRVPCRVVGNIQRGDCLASSDIPGVATALDATKYQPGAVIGKALEDYNSTEPGVIEAVVGRL